MKILLIVAMTSELEGFLDRLDYDVEFINGLKIYKSIYADKEIYIGKSEVGKVNAACLTTTLILKIKPQYVINAGIGGGLNQSLNLLDVVASSKICYHDFDLTAFGYNKGEMDNNQTFFKGSLKLLKAMPDYVKKGLIVSGDQFISGIDKMNCIKNDFPKALVCDMEGCAIAHVSSLLSRKFVVIRAISDNVFLKNHIDVYSDYKTLAIKKVVDATLELLTNIN